MRCAPTWTRPSTSWRPRKPSANRRRRSRHHSRVGPPPWAGALRSSELLVDLRRLAQRREVVLALLEHGIARQARADLLLHLGERLRRNRAAIFHHHDVEAG